MDIFALVSLEHDLNGKCYRIRTKDMRTSFYPQMATVKISGDQSLCDKIYEIIKSHDGDVIKPCE